jgi:probable F420-dependent oxidoreductase
MVQIAIGLYGLQRWYDGDFAPVVGLARIAEDAGIDQVSLTDHVVMGENLGKYPYGAFPAALDFPWFEPLTVLAAIAGGTRRIGLSTGVLIAPLRPAVLLAKQLATLDVMSRGRVCIGLGLGWQREEYEAAGIPWEHRLARLEEQVRACKLLWTEAPASFHGSTVRFERLHAWPRPVQPAGVPIWFGLAPTDRNIGLIAELGDGWIPIEKRPEELARHIARLRQAFAARGRDPQGLAVRALLQSAMGADGRPDLTATLAQVPALVAAGVTMIEVLPFALCRGPGDFAAFCERLAVAKRVAA